jgi:hypothetical protein
MAEGRSIAGSESSVLRNIEQKPKDQTFEIRILEEILRDLYNIGDQIKIRIVPCGGAS